MARRSVKAAGLLFLLLLVLPPSANATPFATLESSEVSVAKATLAGSLAGAAWLPEESTAAPLAPSAVVDLPGFALSARRAEVTVHHVERYLANDVDSQPPTRWTFANVTAVGATGDAKDARLVALPASPEAHILLGPMSLRLVPAATDARHFPARVTGGPDSVIATGSALLIEHDGDHLVEVRGSFRLVIDGLDLTLESDEGRYQVHTRSDVDGADVTTPAGSYAAHSFVHEAVLDLQDAVLRMPASEAFTTLATAVSDGPWSFDDAAGRLATPEGPQDVAGEITMDGPISGVLRRNGPQVEAELSGSPTAVVVDGRSTAIAGLPTGRPTLLAVVAAVLGSAALLVAAHLTVGRWRFGRLDHAMDRADYSSALGLSRGFAWHPRLAQDALLAAAICLLALDRPEDAGARLQGRSDWTVRRRPMRDFLLARAHAALGRRDEAARHLASSLVAEPSLLSQARADPLLADVLRSVVPRAAEEAYA